ncbi:hypothetical protein LTS08_004802 [Lithohypha guttulata]|nr:hypothetical protein LTS08_004802 [Lithohypha guttulata]
MKTARPYRSHKYPACTRCHKRRSRCTIEIPGSACLLCRVHGVPCSSESAKKDERSTPKIGFIHRSLLPDSGYVDTTSHVVGPVVARDTQIIENYIGPISTDVPDGEQAQNSSVSQALNRPIYQMPIPPRRPSPPAQCNCSRNLPLELLAQVDTYFEKLIDVYFEHLYPAFPLLDEQWFMSKLSDRQALPPTFLANFVAYVLYYWNLGPELMLHAKPDQDFAWSVAVQAMMADHQKADISSILTVVLNVAGRPSKGFVSNLTSVSRAVAISHSGGLNHDSHDWKLDDHVKKLRWKMWWAILIHDRWFNFAQGTPPYINKAHYDVPIPTIDLLAGDRANIQKHYRAAECYIELCELTETVGDILPLIYHVKSGNDGMAAEQTSRSEIELNRWQQTRPKWIDYYNFEDRPLIPGLVNLQLSYLAVRMLLRRLAWHEICQRETDPSPTWLESCLNAAGNIARFASSLSPSELAGFWLPYNAHHFTSAVTLLLRCALQTSDLAVRRRSMTSARTLVDCLRRFKDENNWDLAETALTQCEPILRTIEDALVRKSPTTQPQNIDQTSIGVDDAFWDNPMLQYPGFGWSGQPEQLFPGLFSDLYADPALFEPFPEAQQIR